jgi:hypothetical protein
MLCIRFTYISIKSSVSLKDSHGQQVYSAPATVQDGGDSRYGDVCDLSGPFLMTCSNPSCVNNDVKEGKGTSASGSAT